MPYVFDEDSKLLSDVLSKLDPVDNFLEIGVGRGGNLLVAAQKSRFCVGTDIGKMSEIDPSIRSLAELVISDKASCFHQSSFDLIVFNPPYVPSNSVVDLSVDGGEGGIEIPLKFLGSALGALKPDGQILVVLSSEDSLQEFEQVCEGLNLIITKFAEKNLFFEKLFVFAIKRALKNSNIT